MLLSKCKEFIVDRRIRYMKKNWFKMFVFVLMISFISTMNVNAYQEQDDLSVCLNDVKYFKENKWN